MKNHVELAKVLSTHLNGGQHNNDKVIAALLLDHRTIQQNMMRFCIRYIEQVAKRYAEDPPQYFDLRNEASGQLAVEITEKVENRALPYI